MYSSAWFEFLIPLWFPLSIIFFYLGIIIIVAEGINRLSVSDSELTRKVVHIGTGNVILLAWWLDIPAKVGIIASVIASAIAIISYFTPILPSINSVKRRSLGTFFYAVSIGVLMGWFWSIHRPEYAAIGILIMTWGDGMAAIIGQRFGKHPYSIFGVTKSWEGSLTMAIVSFLATILILLFVQGNVWQVWVISLTVALFATILEAFSKFGIDNLTVPIASAFLGFVLSQFLLSSNAI